LKRGERPLTKAGMLSERQAGRTGFGKDTCPGGGNKGRGIDHVTLLASSFLKHTAVK